MKTWKKPELKQMGTQFTELSENDANKIDGGGPKIGVCFIVGFGGDLETYQSPVMIGFCYVIGG
jgi:hypothetical protein